MLGLQRVGQPATGFGNDLDPALDNPLFLPIELEFLTWGVSSLVVDTLDRLDHVRQVGRDR
jgi:hypothetical protein